MYVITNQPYFFSAKKLLLKVVGSCSVGLGVALEIGRLSLQSLVEAWPGLGS